MPSADAAIQTSVTRIVGFAALTDRQKEEAATVLMLALQHVPSAWHDSASARAEVAQFFGNPERMAVAALDGERLVGWIGALMDYDHGWELHPLVIDPSYQRCGCGTLLVRALETMAARAGIGTLWLGTDDDFGGTNIFGEDLYPNVLKRMSRLAAARGHPFTFFQRMGFAVVGALPDVNGAGRHDILMAKRVAAAGS